MKTVHGIKKLTNRLTLQTVMAGLVFALSVFAPFSAAWAKEISTGGDSPVGSILLLSGFMLLLYFLMIRPQNRRAREHRDLLTKLQKGDEVVTSGGVVGTLSRITDQFVVVNVSETVEITLQKQAISSVLPKGTLKSI